MSRLQSDGDGERIFGVCRFRRGAISAHRISNCVKLTYILAYFLHIRMPHKSVYGHSSVVHQNWHLENVSVMARLQHPAMYCNIAITLIFSRPCYTQCYAKECSMSVAKLPPLSDPAINEGGGALTGVSKGALKYSLLRGTVTCSFKVLRLREHSPFLQASCTFNR